MKKFISILLIAIPIFLISEYIVQINKQNIEVKISNKNTNNIIIKENKIKLSELKTNNSINKLELGNNWKN